MSKAVSLARDRDIHAGMQWRRARTAATLFVAHERLGNKASLTRLDSSKGHVQQQESYPSDAVSICVNEEFAQMVCSPHQPENWTPLQYGSVRSSDKRISGNSEVNGDLIHKPILTPLLGVLSRVAKDRVSNPSMAATNDRTHFSITSGADPEIRKSNTCASGKVYRFPIRFGQIQDKNLEEPVP
ncbi:MAG: hypothetical protein R8G34_13725 [Paracoccaceae bacterium]|nr:hypothetical protein [Paracoccaceae bacterium]